MSLRIPVYAGPRCIEFAGAERARHLIAARNATAIIQRKTRRVVEIQLLEHGDDSRLKAAHRNDQILSYRTEDEINPPGVWALKRLFDVTGTAGPGEAGGE